MKKRSTKKYASQVAVKKTRRGILVHGMFEIDFSPLDNSENVDVYVNKKGEKFFEQMAKNDENFDRQKYLEDLIKRTLEEILKRTP